MPEKTKPAEKDEKTAEKKRVEIMSENHSTTGEKISSNSQKKGNYYYDDSYGYEIYNPDDEDDED